jgi:adenosylmethionine-8-amino-7-oxononanoate aminotransferase
MASVELAPELLEQDGGLTGKAAKAIRPHGVILRALARSLAISPPLTITPQELGLIADAIRAGLDDLAEVVEGVPARSAAG